MPRSRRMLVDLLVYAAVRVVALGMLMFPINTNLRTARLLGWIWYRMMPRHRERAREHLRQAYGSQLSARQMDQITLQCMQQLTMMAVEAIFTPRLISEWTWPRYVRLKGLNEAAGHLISNRGAILLTGHYGSWELVGFVLAALGFPVVAVMRPLDNPYLNRYLMDVRARRGLQLLYKKGVSQSAQDILSGGGILAFIADQNAGHKGLFVDFFGRKASTYKSIGLLAIQNKVPVMIGYGRRLSPNFEYEVGVNRIIRPEEWQDKADPLMWITQEYTRAIEDFVREAPEQYLWIHRRWKSRPKDEQKPQAAAPEEPADDADAIDLV